MAIHQLGAAPTHRLSSAGSQVRYAEICPVGRENQSS